MRLSIEEIQKRSNNIHNNEYLFIGLYENYNTPILVRHLVCGYEWEVRIGNHFFGKKCPKCSGNARLTKDDIQKKSNEVHNNEFLIIGDYKSLDDKIEIQHLSCGRKFLLRGDLHIYGKVGCSDCNGGVKLTKDKAQSKLNSIYGDEFKIIKYNTGSKLSIVHHNACNENIEISYQYLASGRGCKCQLSITRWTKEIFIEESKKLHGDCYELISDFINLDTKVTLKHKDCGFIWKCSPKKHIYSLTGCPLCKSSKGEKIIKMYLDNSKIINICQKSFKDCIYIRPLPFDFYLPGYNICIEYDGEHHFKPIANWGGEESFKLQKIKDNIKTKYCEENNIKLYRISYFDDINECINSIINKINIH
jgi:uncharacterized protein YozE (UPF0346 family)